MLVAGMLRPAHLLDLMRNFTVFQQVDGKTRKVVARYQQFRAVHKAVARLQEGRTRTQGAERDERGGIIWHTQGSGKSLSMVFLVRKMRMMPRLNRFKVVVVTDRTDLEGQLRETARLSGETLRPNEYDIGAPRITHCPHPAHPAREHAGHRLRHAAEVSGCDAARQLLRRWR